MQSIYAMHQNGSDDLEKEDHSVEKVIPFKEDEDNEPLLEEENEEVFEVEIDDITYFTNDEENGILYECNKSGEPGKKVGILKDGEPFFYP